MGSSSFYLKAALAAAVFSTSTAAAPTLGAPTSEYLYTQDHRYAGSTFMDQFNFFTGPDPTNGFVNFKSAAEAKTLGLAKIEGSGAAYLGVDTTNKYMNFNTFGRPSLRLESKRTYNGGLFVADIAHMPTGAGTWPAYWTVGLKDWPRDGEIDILEGINEQEVNLGTLHTKTDCLIDASAQGGDLKTAHCSNDYTDGWSQWQNQGCSVLMKEPNNYGVGFNRAGGGIYVTDWQPQHIKIWFFPRNSAAGINALSANPDPTTWPKPSFTTEKGTCNIPGLFKDHTLILDTTFCGDYAGQDIQWQQTSIFQSNPTKYAKCHDYVGAHPEAFKEAYWRINSINVYKRSKNPSYVSSTSSSIASSTTSIASTSSSTIVSTTTSILSSTSASASPTVLPGGLTTSPDGSCGNKYSCEGFPSLTGYSCCNKYGRCGSSVDDCTGCKVSHSTPGKCNANPPVSSSSTTSAPVPTSTLVTSPDGSCGNKYTCNGYTNPLGYSCCNIYGRCGSSAADCTGCKVSHSTPGKCNAIKPSSSSTSSGPAPTSTLKVSPDGSCGNLYTCAGFASPLGYSCCNKYGRCGSSADDCTGCKVSHSSPGKCNAAKPSTTTPAPAPTSTLKTSPDGSCGNLYTCAGFASPLGYSCCNKYGRCGSSADDCTGCKVSHSSPGKCNAAKPSTTTSDPAPTSTLKTSPDGSCGNLYTCSGFPNSLGYSCCNKYGRCGSTAADCGAGSGCKASHSTAGKCNTLAAAPKPVYAAPAKIELVKSPNGSCGNSYTCTGYASTLGYSCCSKYGYCGDSAEHCGTGCKKGYGACF